MSWAPRQRSLVAIGAMAMAVPIAASAAGQDLIIDFQSSGVMKDLLAKTMAVAKSFLFLSTFLAYVLEAFGKSPTAERDYAAVTWRLVVVLFLLWNYQTVFGSVVSLMDRIDREVAPPSTWQAFSAEVASMQKALEDMAASGQASQAGANGTGAAASPPSTIVSWAYEALISCVELVAEGVVFLIRWMSRILTATLFILGPLALVASIPRASHTGTRWFQRFVTIASWPVFASVMLSVMVTLAAQGAARHTYLECLVAALVMLVTSLSTPTLASHVVGGALQNFAAIGFQHTKSAHRDVSTPARSVASAATGATGRVVAAASSIAGRFTGGGPGGAPGPSSGGAGQGSLGSGSITANPPGAQGSPGVSSGKATQAPSSGSGAATSKPAPPRNVSGGSVSSNSPAPPRRPPGARDPGPDKGGSVKP